MPSETENKTPPQGRLYLVGTGCGDFDNITLRAVKVIVDADLIIAPHDGGERLSPLLKDKEVRGGSLSVFGDNGMTRSGNNGKPIPKEELARKKEELRALIRDAVGEGKNVAILDGGDPGIFGPQACNLSEFADLSPEVIPGLSCLSAANAALGMSVVGGGNGHATITLSAISGTRQEPAEPADPEKSMVFFTMKSAFADSLAYLRARYPLSTPIAVIISAGSGANQCVIRSTLSGIHDAVGSEELPFEHLIYVGNFLHKD